MNRTRVENQFACFNLSNIQDIIDKGEEMLSTPADNQQSLFNFWIRIPVGEDLRISKDCVKGVRSSWLIFERKTLFAWFAVSAFSFATASSSVLSLTSSSRCSR